MCINVVFAGLLLIVCISQTHEAEQLEIALTLID